MAEINNLIKYEKCEIEKEEQKLRELKLIKELVDIPDIKYNTDLQIDSNGNYLLVIQTTELTPEIEDTLDFSIVVDSNIRTAGDGVEIEFKLNFDKYKVSQTLMDPVVD